MGLPPTYQKLFGYYSMHRDVLKLYGGSIMLSKFRLFSDVTVNDETLGMLNFEYFSMKKTILEREISALEKKVTNENGTYSKKAVQGFKSDLETAKANLEVAKNNVATLPQSADATTRTLLRLEACQVNSKMLPLAIVLSDEQIQVVEDSMGAYHVEGKGKKKECDNVLKDLIFNIISHESEIIPRHNFRQNAKMLRKLHETYVKGLAFNGGVKERKDKDGNIKQIFSRNESTLYGSITTKKGVKIYDAFARDLATVCIDSINTFYNKCK